MGGGSSSPPPPRVETKVVYVDRPAPRPKTPPPKPLLDKPWRDIGELNKGLEEELIGQIKELIDKKKQQNARLIMLGPVSAGKSSYINIIASIDKGDLATVSMVGSDMSSLSRKLIIYRPFKHLSGFRLIDTMGVGESEGRGFHVKDLTYIIKGHIKADYRFNPMNPVTEDHKDFIHNPKKKDKAHCVVFVMDARVVASESVSDKTQLKIDQLQEDIKATGLQRILILTNIDLLCPEVSKDVRNAFRSVKVKQAVDEGSRIFGLPEMNVFPVENYHREMCLNPIKHILALSALKAAVNFSSDFMRMEAQQSGNHSSSDED